MADSWFDGWLKGSAFDRGKKGKSPGLIDPRHIGDYNRGVAARRTEQNFEQLGQAAGDLGGLIGEGIGSVISSWWDVASPLVDRRPLCWINGLGEVLMCLPRKIFLLIWASSLAAFWIYMLNKGIDQIEPIMLRSDILFSVLGCGLLAAMPVIIGGMLRFTAGAIAMFLIATWQLIKIVCLAGLVIGILFLLYEALQFGIAFFRS